MAMARSVGHTRGRKNPTTVSASATQRLSGLCPAKTPLLPFNRLYVRPYPACPARVSSEHPDVLVQFAFALLLAVAAVVVAVVAVIDLELTHTPSSAPSTSTTMSSSLLTGAFRTAAAATSARAALLQGTSAHATIAAAALVAPRAARGYAAHHEEESFEAFNARYVTFFKSVEDLFELQRGLNNCFSYDLVPAPEVLEEAIRAARRVNDYPTAVRVFEGVKEKVENAKQYQQYVDALKPVKEELGISLKEELYHA
ncbi:unnamed protein product [Tilletia laevis]|uniref:Cytochrome c oxidase subunit 6, mitochondrial n=4 Tax=Tilletia TaxID=13289 RepID=A0A8X7MWN1_9BASI|nr:hypothetical protein CF336_g2514 [Tilletia laevis]KAE8202188.1 hypothetical protein CF328_g2354 [Tilletia controversa]KAE8262093.1 hypothetical protein A4X03_0g2725 [Tilletia caries]KAE8201445.1 hypothetical protein CF335_g3737 [Tilletia laevis]KAE8249963.1 hypothetical protein A4X06_0g2990 [Tilletia controversa]